MKQKQWNVITSAAILIIILGIVLVREAHSNLFGRVNILLGVVFLIAGVVGGSREYQRNSYRCPACGKKFRPTGRWFPEAGFNGTNTVPCPYCGAIWNVLELKQDE